jgi:hypothetical protein
MSPREKHISDDAQRTSVCLTAKDRVAVLWIAQSRRVKKSKRTTTNDILVDGLWELFDSTGGKTRDEIEAMAPVVPPSERSQNKVTQMPKSKH